MTHTSVEHGKLVDRLSKPGHEIMATMTPAKCELLHMVMGASGEMGEVLDLVKKIVFYDRVIDTDGLTKEMGDVEFYLNGLRKAIGVSRETILRSNITKLDKRYPSGTYSNEQAAERADMKEE